MNNSVAQASAKFMGTINLQTGIVGEGHDLTNGVFSLAIAGGKDNTGGIACPAVNDKRTPKAKRLVNLLLGFC